MSEKSIIQSKKNKIKIGDIFGRLTVIKFAGRNKYSQILWLCKCECGSIKVIQSGSLKYGATKSCGCLSMEKRTKHGMSRILEYKIWAAMIQRCTNPKDQGYHYYGVRGIKVCQKWIKSFILFYNDLGSKPIGYTLERKNNDGDYEPNNCIWASRAAQSRNQRLRKNNKTGINGVHWNEQRQKYHVQITANCKAYFIGLFSTLEAAKIARLEAEEIYWE